MGDIGETFVEVTKTIQARNRVRDEFYSEIIENLGGKRINNSIYRLGEYNVYTSKGYVLSKSNQGKSIPLQVFLREQYDFEVDGKELNERMIQSGNEGK